MPGTGMQGGARLQVTPYRLLNCRAALPLHAPLEKTSKMHTASPLLYILTALQLALPAASCPHHTDPGWAALFPPHAPKHQSARQCPD